MAMPQARYTELEAMIKERIARLEEELGIWRQTATDQVELDLITMHELALGMFEACLAQLQGGQDYGYCKDCKGEIEAEKLRALPYAVTCKLCAEEAENGEKRTAALMRQKISDPLLACLL